MPFIMLTVLIDMMAIGLIIPVLPALVGTFTGSQADQAFWFGATTFAFSIANFFSSPILGGLSDRFGRRPVLLGGMALYCVASVMGALAQEIGPLVVWRGVQGAAMAAAVTCGRSMVRDLFQPHEGARVMSRARFGSHHT